MMVTLFITNMYMVLFGILIASANCNALQNKMVETYIDATSQLIRVLNVVTVQILKNDEIKPRMCYRFIPDPSWASNISFIEAKNENKQALNITKVVQDSLQIEYDIQLPVQASPGNTNIYITYIVTNYQQSYPKYAEQGDKHLVLLRFNVYYYSLYFTEEQSTVLYLGKNVVISIDGEEEVKSNNKKQDSLRYGPYSRKKPMSRLESVVHFENISPFLTVEKLERSVQISHWGYLQVKEDITIINTGPTFKGPFKRQNKMQPDTRVESFITSLPENAFDICLKDEIGLIWSFDTFPGKNNEVQVKIQPRFIMYGGWKTQYQISYSLPIDNYIYASGPNNNIFSLNIPLVDKTFPMLFIKEARVNLILPEGAVYQHLSPDNELANNTDKAFCYYLDIICRQIVSFERYNLVDKHIITVQLYYSYSQYLLLLKPFLTAGYLYFIFLLLIVITYVKPSEDTTKMKPLVHGTKPLDTTKIDKVVTGTPNKTKQKSVKKQKNKKH